MRLFALLALLAAAASMCTVHAAGSARWRDKFQAKTESAKLNNWLGKQGGVATAASKSFWQDWKAENLRNYVDGSALDKARQQQFEAQLAVIVQHNLKLKNDSNPDEFFMSPNSFTDLSWQEFKAGYLGADATLAPDAVRVYPVGPLLPAAVQPLPSRVDWVGAGKVTPPKAQNGCNACWAFAAAAALESQELINRNKTWDLSEQHLIDCVDAGLGYQSRGCSGGWPTDALNYIYRFNVTTETRYTYKNVSQSCRKGVITSSTGANSVKIATSPGYSVIQGLTNEALKTALVSQPVLVAFNAESSFQNYGGGIYPASSCSSTTVNHAMLVVGYSTLNKAWKVKNSWGTAWGEDGFARIETTTDFKTYPRGPCAMLYYKYVPKP